MMLRVAIYHDLGIAVRIALILFMFPIFHTITPPDISKLVNFLWHVSILLFVRRSTRRI
jgi:hypothetical protein